MTALMLARWQFGITTVFPFLFVPLTIGLAFLVAIFQTAAHRTANEASPSAGRRLRVPGQRSGTGLAEIPGTVPSSSAASSPAVLWGVAWRNILRGVPIDPQHRFIGSLAGLLNPYALWAGFTTAALFTLHGAVYLTLRTDDEVLERSRAFARRITWPAAVAVVGFLVWTYVNANRAGYKGLVPPLVPAVTIVLVTVTIFLNLYPRVMVSSLGPANSLTIDNAASGR